MVGLWWQRSEQGFDPSEHDFPSSYEKRYCRSFEDVEALRGQKCITKSTCKLALARQTVVGIRKPEVSGAHALAQATTRQCTPIVCLLMLIDISCKCSPGAFQSM